MNGYHFRRLIIMLILSAILAWLYRILFFQARIEFRPDDALEHVDVQGHSARWAE